METLYLSYEDRLLIANLTAEIKRFNDREERPPKDIVLTLTQVANMAGKTRQTISRWIRQGRIHKVERGGMVGILSSELDSIIRR